MTQKTVLRRPSVLLFAGTTLSSLMLGACGPIAIDLGELDTRPIATLDTSEEQSAYPSSTDITEQGPTGAASGLDPASSAIASSDPTVTGAPPDSGTIHSAHTVGVDPSGELTSSAAATQSSCVCGVPPEASSSVVSASEPSYGVPSYGVPSSDAPYVDPSATVSETVPSGTDSAAAPPSTTQVACTCGTDPSATAASASSSSVGSASSSATPEPVAGSTTAAPQSAFCGNGIVEVELGEECDAGANTGSEQCGQDCRLPQPSATGSATSAGTAPPADTACGDGILDVNEECDAGADNGGSYCTLICTIASTN